MGEGVVLKVSGDVGEGDDNLPFRGGGEGPFRKAGEAQAGARQAALDDVAACETVCHLILCLS
jgi:hypothetical protein